MRRLLLLAALIGVGTTSTAFAANDGKAQYVGGTLSVAEKTQGVLDLSHEREVVFRYKGGETVMPYDGIASIEYGQKAGRRVGAAVVVSPLFLLSKKRKHYVTVSFMDQSGAKQGAVFEVSKNAVHRFVTTLASRSGKEIEFESEEAKKHLAKEAK